MDKDKTKFKKFVLISLLWILTPLAFFILNEISYIFADIFEEYEGLTDGLVLFLIILELGKITKSILKK